MTWKSLSPRMRIIIWFAVTLLFFVILLSLIIGTVSLLTSASRENGTITFTCGVGLKRDPAVEVPRSVYCPGGIPYADFTRLASACFSSQSGDEEEIRYIIKGTNGSYDTVTFFYDSRKAIVNGADITLSHPVKRYGSSVLVPCDFIEGYMSGITVTVTEARIRLIYSEGRVSFKPSLDAVTPIDPTDRGN